jgi:hypothetical protein
MGELNRVSRIAYRVNMTNSNSDTRSTSRGLKWLLFFVLFFAGVAAFIYSSPYFLQKQSDPAPVLRILNMNIGATHFRIPEHYIRDPDQRSHGARARIYIAVTWPDFAPLIPPRSLLSAETPSPIIFMTLEAADDTINPAHRPSSLYSRFLTTDVNEGSSQLVTRIFKAGTPYAGEVLHIAPPNGESFSARCQIVKNPAARSEHCLWQLRLDKLDVQVRFSEELLPDWEALSINTKAMLENIITAKP